MFIFKLEKYNTVFHLKGNLNSCIKSFGKLQWWRRKLPQSALNIGHRLSLPIVHKFIRVVEVQGQLGEKPVSQIIRYLAQKNASGLLRISRGKTIKAIFFESGNPIFAISNAANEQLEYKLIQEGLVTPAQIEQAKQQSEKANKLGPALIEMGVLSAEKVQEVVREQVVSIIISIFEWEQGDYVFDERMRASHEITIDRKVTDILLIGARQAANIQSIAQQIAPPDSVVVRNTINKEQSDSGKLVPLESYVLSRIDAPTAVSEVGTISGLPEEEAQRAVCALIASGFLKLVGEDKEEETIDSSAAEALEKLNEDINRKQNYYNNSDYYEILEISRQATTSEIKAAYYQLAKKYHPDRYRQAEHAEIRSKLENLFARITQAYETLSQPASRATYDEKLRKGNANKPIAAKVITTPLPSVAPVIPLPNPKVPSGSLAAGEAPKSQAAPIQTQTVQSVVQDSSNSAASQKGAEYYYQQGRARLERKEYHAAIHLLREAVKLEPAKAVYHFHLGSALIRNPKTRREADEHLSKSAELDPYNSQIRVKLGLIYKEVGLKKRAEHFFKDALSLDPDNRMAKKEIGAANDAKKEEMPSIWKSDMGTIAKRLFKR